MGWLSQTLSDVSNGDVGAVLGDVNGGAASAALSSLPSSPTAGALAFTTGGAALSIPGLYNSMAGILSPSKPDLTNPSSVAPVNLAAATQTAVAQTLQTETQMGQSSSYMPFSESLDQSTPNTTGRVLLGS